jgi:glycosyltransferase involved in cell wall biosynthesis
MRANNINDMIEGKSVIYFGPGKWEGLWRNRHQLMSRFAKKNKVVYVEPPLNIKKTLREYNLAKLGLSRWIKVLLKPRITEELKNLYIYHTPFYAPIIGRFRIKKLSWWLWKKLLRNKLKALGMEKPIIWFSHPTMAHLTNDFDSGLTIYHVVDEYSAYDNINDEMKAQINKIDKEMAEKADLVFVVSEKLFTKRKGYNPHTWIIPNGVDYEKYQNAMSSNDTLPDDIKNLPKPIIGYSGLIGSYIDLKLIEQIAFRHPNWSLVLVGQNGSGADTGAFEKLIQMDNVYYLGNKSIDALPHYLKTFDVCLIPYKETEQVINSSSLKLYDYMAFGKPIVATSFPVSRALKDLLFIGSSAESFIGHVETAVFEDEKRLSEQRKEYAAANTWDHRVLQASALIEKRLDSKLN